MDSILSFIQATGTTTDPLIVVVLAILLAKEKGWLPFVKGKNNDMGDMVTMMRQLKAHYNDETTDVLREIRDETRSMNTAVNSKLDVIATKQQIILDKVIKIK
jgi:Tfp pilus assembly protein PilO